MIDYLAPILALLTFSIFFFPMRLKYWITLIILLAFIAITSIISINVLSTQTTQDFTFTLFGNKQLPTFTVDVLAAFFILVVNFTTFTALLFAKSYLASYIDKKPPLRFSIHYFSFLWLYLSMIMVCTINSGFSFLIVWEFMSLSSFLLVVFDAENRQTMKAGINYFIQMHVGFIFLLIGFIVLELSTGVANFNELTTYFSTHNNIALFILFFIGFGIKAGFFPIHSWLPMAHPAAPSHVSGLMSGVMIKMGIYGILRIVFALQDQLLMIGSFVLIVSIFSGLLGIMFAIVQNDIKQLLAYSSIENIGIIGIGIGLGIIGKATHQPAIEILGFGGGLLHVLNHSLYKSLLFYTSGSVYISTHTRNIEQLGGLIKKMPYTAILFLIGALAISGLPPFNGFISEYLIYVGFYKSLNQMPLYESMLLISGIIGMALIGGMALFGFTKAFSIIFLGNSRSEATLNAKESSKLTIITLFSIVGIMALIGLAPILVLKPIFSTIQTLTHTTLSNQVALIQYQNINSISIIGGIFITTTTLLLTWRYFHLNRLQMNNTGPTWGCGYSASTSKHQYTSTSFADNFSKIAQPILQTRIEGIPFTEKDIFPSKRHFASHKSDIIKKFLIDKPIELLLNLLKHLSIMQTGQIQHYILYSVAFIALITILTYLNVL